MELIRLTEENLSREHICCAISKETDPQVVSKKGWLRERMREGLVFLRSTERGKCFIEYLPAEYAWVPIEAENYMYIDCFWVSGSLKGHGYANALLDACIEDSRAKGRSGLCVLSSQRKKPFLSDPGYLAHRGFTPCDDSDIGVQLWYLPLADGAEPPQLRERARHPHVEESGFVLYYTRQCPFVARYVPVLEQLAAEKGIALTVRELEDRASAQAAPTPVTTYALFRDGRFVTHEILSEKRLKKLLEE